IPLSTVPAPTLDPHSFPTRRSSDLWSRSFLSFRWAHFQRNRLAAGIVSSPFPERRGPATFARADNPLVDEVYVRFQVALLDHLRSEEHTSELQSHLNLLCRLLL